MGERARDMDVQPRMRKLLKVLKITAVNIVILAVLVEALSIATYFFQTGDFFYQTWGHHKITGIIAPQGPINPGSEQPTTAVQLHPYFGFVNRAGSSHRASYSTVAHAFNNFGFASNYPYPFKRQNSNQFIVGVFGGSVAWYYSSFEMERNILANELRRLPGLADKEIVILPFAVGAYKQPQQLIVLNYFLSVGQDFDLVINIDGFNEVALAYINQRDGLDGSMPCGYILMPLVNLATCNVSEDELQLTLEVIRDKKRLQNSIQSLENSRMATGYLISWLRARLSERRYGQDVMKLDRVRASTKRSAQTYAQITVRPTSDEGQVFKEAVANWSSSSLMMKALLDQRKIPYFQFIQPNQYEPTGRVFSKSEAALAIDEKSDFRLGVLRGYPLLLAELQRLQQSGVNSQSAINVFDKIAEPVYEDNCCHYNERGNTIFCEFIAHAVAQALSRDARYATPVSSGK
jgi:hypothetical protein